jgi:hypothetical protein
LAGETLHVASIPLKRNGIGDCLFEFGDRIQTIVAPKKIPDFKAFGYVKGEWFHILEFFFQVNQIRMVERNVLAKSRVFGQSAVSL